MEHAIVIQDVTKRFRETVAVSHVTACFETGKIHGIIGRNGSGKTVLFKCICLSLSDFRVRPHCKTPR